MTADPLIIRYDKIVPERDGRREFLAGEEYAVADAAAARKYHPDATIVGHLSGKPYNTPKSKVPAAKPALKRSRGGVTPPDLVSAPAEEAGTE